METILGSLGGDSLRQMSGQLGADEKTTGTAASAAVATLLGALSRNSSKPAGAEALAGALAKDHDGSILDNLSGFLAQADQGPGDGILKHVLGNRRPVVERSLSRSTGMDSGSVGKLLTMVAPVVLGALGKAQRQKGMSSSALAGFLGQERETMERRQPQAMSALSGLLDTDGDGDVDMGDLAKHGAGLLGKLFGK